MNFELECDLSELYAMVAMVRCHVDTDDVIMRDYLEDMDTILEKYVVNPWMQKNDKKLENT